MLLVTSVFLFMLAGYYLLASPRNKQVARAVPVEQTAPAPAQSEQKPAGDSGSVPARAQLRQGWRDAGGARRRAGCRPEGPRARAGSRRIADGHSGQHGQTIATAAGIALHEPARRPSPRRT